MIHISDSSVFLDQKKNVTWLVEVTRVLLAGGTQLSPALLVMTQKNGYMLTSAIPRAAAAAILGYARA